MLMVTLWDSLAQNISSLTSPDGRSRVEGDRVLEADGAPPESCRLEPPGLGGAQEHEFVNVARDCQHLHVFHRSVLRNRQLQHGSAASRPATGTASETWDTHSAAVSRRTPSANRCDWNPRSGPVRELGQHQPRRDRVDGYRRFEVIDRGQLSTGLRIGRRLAAGGGHDRGRFHSQLRRSRNRNVRRRRGAARTAFEMRACRRVRRWRLRSLFDLFPGRE